MTIKRVIDGLAKSAARQITAGLFEEDQSAVQALADRTALAHALSSAFPWTCRAAAQVLLDAVKMSELAQDPSATLRSLLARLVEVARRAWAQGSCCKNRIPQATLRALNGV